MYRITQDDIVQLEWEGRPAEMIERARQWLVDSRQADELAASIETAFAGVKLGDGVGLFQAQGIDDYASHEEQARLREKDEKNDWRQIPDEHLNRCYSSPTFFDAAGYYFHLPAFMCAELRGTHQYDFFGSLMRHRFDDHELLRLLTDAQRAVIIDCLEFLRKSPDYDESQVEIGAAIERLKSG